MFPTGAMGLNNIAKYYTDTENTTDIELDTEILWILTGHY